MALQNDWHTPESVQQAFAWKPSVDARHLRALEGWPDHRANLFHHHPGEAGSLPSKTEPEGTREPCLSPLHPCKEQPQAAAHHHSRRCWGRKNHVCRVRPAPVVIQTEDGLGNLDATAFPLAATFDDVMSALQSLYTEEHPFKTLVVDSLDWLEPLVWQKVCTTHNVASIEAMPYGRATWKRRRSGASSSTASPPCAMRAV